MDRHFLILRSERPYSSRSAAETGMKSVVSASNSPMVDGDIMDARYLVAFKRESRGSELIRTEYNSALTYTQYDYVDNIPQDAGDYLIVRSLYGIVSVINSVRRVTVFENYEELQEHLSDISIESPNGTITVTNTNADWFVDVNLVADGGLVVDTTGSDTGIRVLGDSTQGIDVGSDGVFVVLNNNGGLAFATESEGYGVKVVHDNTIKNTSGSLGVNNGLTITANSSTGLLNVNTGDTLTVSSTGVIDVNTGSTLTVSNSGIIDVNVQNTIVRNNSGALGVNIDNSTIIADATTGVLSVDSAALKIGGSQAIVVTNDTTTSPTSKIISLALDGNSLAQSNSGLKTNIEIHQLSNAEISSAGLGTNVREAYALRDASGDTPTIYGDYIKIYKDSSLYMVQLGHMDDTLDTSGTYPVIIPGTGKTALDFVYRLADGSYTLVKIDVSSFLEELEVVGDGTYITVTSTGTSGERMVSHVAPYTAQSSIGQASDVVVTADGTTSTVNIPILSTDAAGHVTKLTSHTLTITIPAIATEIVNPYTLDPAYPTTNISDYFINYANANEVTAGDTFQVAINKVDNKLAALANEVANNEAAWSQLASTIATSCGLNSVDLTYQADGTSFFIREATSLFNADQLLDDAIAAVASNTKNVIGGDGIAVTEDTNDLVTAYIVGGTALASDWLSASSNGTALTPNTDTTYMVLTTGSYYGKMYTFNGTTYEATTGVNTTSVSVDLAEFATQGSTTTPHANVSNLLIIDNAGKLSISDTWDCGYF